MGQMNPYQPPRAQVADAGSSVALGSFVEGGRAVDAGRGWSWLAEAFGLFRKRPGAWILIIIILGVMMIALNLVPILGAIVNVLLLPVLFGGLLLGCRALEEDGEFGVGRLFSAFSDRPGRLMVVGALSLLGGIVIMIPMIVAMGGAFLGAMSGDPTAAAAAVGPGFAIGLLLTLGLSVLLYMALWFAPSLIVFQDEAPVAALKQSFRACLKNIVPFLFYGVIVFVLAILAAIPLGLGFLVLGPVLVASIYTAYRDIFYQPG